VTLEDSNKKKITLLNPSKWSKEMGTDWIYLLFDLFQIRTIATQFSEVTLDLVEYASKPTIYHTAPNFLAEKGPVENDLIKFALIRAPKWESLLFKISQPVLVKLDSDKDIDFSLDDFFPLYSTNLKEIFLGSEGEIKILKN